VTAARLLDDEVAYPGRGSEARVLVLACGAIAREVLAVIELNGWAHVDVRCLPAKLHSRPERIPAAVDAKLTELAGRYERVFVAYADCGTGGELDKVLERHEVERLPGAHCYGFLAGNAAWDAMQEDEPATYYLTDFLARHFDAIVVRAYRLEERPELLPLMFGNYKRLVYLAQTDDPELRRRAQAAAAYLGLAYEERRTGYGDLLPSLTRFVDGQEEPGVVPKRVRGSGLTRGGAAPEGRRRVA
jgi:Protein of unknown function (DUF1638)